jgi:hypothetical protein
MTTGGCLAAVAAGEVGTAAGLGVATGAVAVGIAAFVAAAGALGAPGALGGVVAGALACGVGAVPKIDGLPVCTSQRSHSRNSDMPKKIQRTVR